MMKVAYEIQDDHNDKDGMSRSSPARNDGQLDATTDMRCSSASDIELIYRSKVATALLKSTYMFLTIKSNVPFSVCLQSMAEYDRDFALIYDSTASEVIGCLDEETIIRMFCEETCDTINMSCKDVLGKIKPKSFTKVPETYTGWDALSLLLKQSSERLFLWREEKDVPLGFLTPMCYIRHMSESSCNDSTALNQAVDITLVTDDTPVIQEDIELKQAIEILIKHRRVLVESNSGQILGLLHRSIIVKYIISLFKRKDTVELSTPIADVLNDTRDPSAAPYTPLEVTDAIILQDYIRNLLNSSTDAVLYLDSHSGIHYVVTALALLLHVMRPLIGLVAHVSCSNVRDVAVEEVERPKKVAISRGGVTIPSLTVARDASGNSIVNFDGEPSYSLGVDSQGNFSISAANQPMLIIDNSQTVSLHISKLTVRAVDFDGDLVVQGVSQFKMIWREEFSDSRGWTGTVDKIGVSSCAGIPMLGGYKLFGRGYVQKTFIELPVHRELRIKANFHFLDQWSGESGYMKLNPSASAPLDYVWTDFHFQKSESGVNICGGDVADSKFSVPIEVIIPHSAERFTIEFGSTLEGDSIQQSWGISGLEIHVR